MRRRLLTIVWLAVGVLLVLPGAGNAQTAPQDSVTGTASFDFGVPQHPFLQTYEFSAFSGPSGEDPTGTVSFVGIVFDVTCLAVAANRAVIGAHDAVNDAFIYFVVNDAGATGDTFRAAFPPGGPFGGQPATDCASVIDDDIPLGPIDAGNIVVTDAQPFPTAKDQCKNGGWRNYGTAFKNEGHCVSFVATGGKKAA